MLMNAATTPHPAKVGRHTAVGSFITSFRLAWVTYQERTRLHAELSQYSDRELSDMSLSRADIRDMVRSWQPG